MNNKELIWSLPIYGDDLEQEASDFVANRMSLYETNWGLFVGNKGNAVPADLIQRGRSLVDDHPLILQRQKFAQYHYTILESAWGIERLLKRRHETWNSQSARDMIDDFILYHAFVGRIIDSIERAMNALGGGFKFADDDSLKIAYSRRNVALHGPHPPMARDEIGIVYMVPPSSKRTADKSEWSDKTGSWIVQRATGDSVVLGTYCVRGFEEILGSIRNHLGNFKNMIHEILKSNDVSLARPAIVSPEKYVATYRNDSLSGSGFVIFTPEGN